MAEDESRGAVLHPQTATAVGTAVRVLGGARVAGTVIASEPALREPARLRLPQALHRALIALEVLAAPLALAVWLLSSGHLFAAVGLGAALLFAARFLRPTGLLGLLGLSQLFRSGRGTQDVAVRHIRVRTQDLQEVAVRASGELDGGHLMPGDEVELAGWWHWGVLDLKSATNLRTGARTSFHVQGGWAPLLVHLGVLALVVAVLVPTLLVGHGGR